MSYKACPQCQKTNAIANASCVGCGCVLRDVPIQHQVIGTQRRMYVLKRLFSSLVTGCVLTGLFFALMAWLDQPAFMVLRFQ